MAPPLVIAGAYDSFGIRHDGTVASAGSNYSGRLDCVADATDVIGVAGVAGYPVVLLHNDGTLSACGPYAPDVSGYAGVAQISGGASHVVARLADGTVSGDGDDSDGQVSGAAGWTGITQLAAGGMHTVGLLADGTVVACGNDDYGQVSGVAGWTGVVEVAAGYYHTIARLADRSVVGCGHNGFGQLDNLSAMAGAVQIAACQAWNLGRMADGSVVGNGYPSTGLTTALTWQHVEHVSLHPAGLHSLALLADGSAVAAGEYPSDACVTGVALWGSLLPESLDQTAPTLVSVAQHGRTSVGMRLGTSGHVGCPSPLVLPYRQAIDGEVAHLTLADSAGALFPLLTADITLSGAVGCYAQMSLAPALLAAIVAAAPPFHLVDQDGRVVFSLPSIDWRSYRGAKNTGLVVTARATADYQRIPQRRAVAAPVAIVPQAAGTVAVSIPGAWDLVPGDVIDAGGLFSGLVGAVTLHFQRGGSRSVVYG